MSSLKLMFVGDISLGEHYFSFGHGPRTTAYKQDILASVKPIFAAADYVCGNLEGPISDIGLNTKDPESVVFRGDPQAAKTLADAGFNLMHVANNHIIQHGEQAYRHTLTLLENNNIIPIGNFGDECILEKNGVKIAIIAGSDVLDNTFPEQQLYETLNVEKILEKIEKVKGTVDWILLSLHWGKEEKVSPTQEQIDMARRFKDAGVNFIIGHHPHIFFPVELAENYLCAWSLGNFIFDLPWDKRLCKSAILEIELNKNTFDAKVYPITILPNGTPVNVSTVKKITEGNFCLYDNSSAFRFFSLMKILFFASNFFRGKVSLKFIFIKRKVLKKFGL